MKVARLLNGVLRRTGYEIRRVPLQRSGSTVRNYTAQIARIRDYTMLSEKKLTALAHAVSHLVVKEIDGAIVQCGVWRGGSMALAAQVVSESGGKLRPLHLFDSFEGIPEPNERIDGERAIKEARAFGVGTTGRLIANPQLYVNMGRSVGALEDSEHLLRSVVNYNMDLVHYHKGFFERTVPPAAGRIGDIALLHLDGDWYSSTKVCLDHLYNAVVPGGIVIIDDYAAYEGCRRAVDEFLVASAVKSYLYAIDSEARMFQKL